MRRFTLLALTVILAGCVAPPALPPRLFDSPLAAPGTYRIYVPGALSSPRKFGLSMALLHRSCAYPAQVGAIWYYDWRDGLTGYGVWHQSVLRKHD